MESHYTATGLVVNKDRTRVLVVYHKKLQLWLPAGGHVDEGELPHQAAIREVFEETGIQAQIISASPTLVLRGDTEVQIAAPLFILHENIPTYKDKPAHLHYDFVYYMQTQHQECIINERELDSVSWMTIDQIASAHTTDATRQMIAHVLSDCCNGANEKLYVAHV